MHYNVDTSNSKFDFLSQRYSFSLLNESHREFYCSLYSNTTVMKKIAEPLDSMSLSQLFQRVLKHNGLGLSHESKSLNWIIRDLSTDQNVGIQGFKQKPYNPSEAEFGIMLSPKNHQKGIANESIAALIKYGFTEMEFSKLYANYTTQNKAIQRIAQNLDFNISSSEKQANSKYCWLTKQEFVTRLHLFEK